MQCNRKKNQKGFSLIEMIIAIFILSVCVLAVFSLYDLSIRVTWENKAKTIATQLANQRIEMLRNIPYENVGTVSGIPSGDTPQYEQITLNNIPFTIETTIIYVDDPFDGLLGQDPQESIANDYKKVQIKVSWPEKMGSGELSFYTNISPKGIEGIEGGGALKITVFDASGNPLSLASVHITNDNLVPSVDTTLMTNPEGVLLVPGTKASTDGYHIEVTHTMGQYSTDQTYEITSENVNPTLTPIIVNENEVATASFAIDQVSNLNILFQDTNLVPLSGITVQVNGQKIIGTNMDGDPIFKYDDDTLVSNAQGRVILENIEWDSYQIKTTDSSPFAVSQVEPALPIDVLPFTNNNVTITLQPKNNHSILFVVQDSDGNPIDDAEINIYNEDTTDDQTDLTTPAGQLYFADCDEGATTVSITKAGYDNYNDQIDVSGYVYQKIILSD